MRAWADRPIEEASLFNPAFVSILLALAALDYSKQAGVPMPWLFSFLVPPVVLHQGTREALPKTTTAHLSTWLVRNTDVHAGFGERAAAFTPIVQEALRYGLTTRALRFDNGRLVSFVPERAGSSLGSVEARECAKRAAFLGRWFARTQDPATTFALFGVAP